MERYSWQTHQPEAYDYVVELRRLKYTYKECAECLKKDFPKAVRGRDPFMVTITILNHARPRPV